MAQRLIQTEDCDILIGIPEGACKDCEHYEPNYDEDKTDWKCPESEFKPDDNCEYFIGIKEEKE